jgi:glycosyltransferase involved in cell wall biosynthesis
MRTWSLLRALAAEGHDVSLLTFAEAEELDGHLAAVKEVCPQTYVIPLKLVNLSSPAGYLGRLRGLFSAKPYALRRFASRPMRERVIQHLKRGEFDAVMCDTIFSLVNLPLFQVPLLLNNPDVEYVVLERYLAFETNWAKRLYARFEAVKVRRWEQCACQRATAGMACSEHDRSLLQALAPNVPIFVVPNVVDTENYEPGHEGDGRTILYQGGMDWFPNRDAVSYFVEQMLPGVSSQFPGVRFVIAGRNPSLSFQQRFAGISNLQFTGTVPDMRPIVSGADICIVPLRIGSGTRLKILEAAALGKAVVSTALGAEGLNFEAGKEIWIADDPASFSQAIVQLLRNPELRRQMGDRARKRVESDYSFAVLQTSLRRLSAHFSTSTVPSFVEDSYPGLDHRPS